MEAGVGGGDVMECSRTLALSPSSDSADDKEEAAAKEITTAVREKRERSNGRCSWDKDGGEGESMNDTEPSTESVTLVAWRHSIVARDV